jgi:translation initiation factor 1
MSDQDIQIPGAFDPFADANAEDSGAGSKDYVHVRVQQRNGRKSLTTVQGLKKEFNYNKILKDFKKVYHLLLCLHIYIRVYCPFLFLSFGLPL